MTDTNDDKISTALADAIARAERYVDENELSHSTREARIALHAVLNYIGTLGASGDDHIRVLYLLSDASSAAWSKGYHDRADLETKVRAICELPEDRVQK